MRPCRSHSRFLLFFLLSLFLACPETRLLPASAQGSDQRPQYRIDLTVDQTMMAYRATERISVPATAADPLTDVVCFLYANAPGIGGTDIRHGNVVVDSAALDAIPVSYEMKGPVLRVQLPHAEDHPFWLEILCHGVTPRSPPDSGGIADLMGGLGSDLSGLLGGGTTEQKSRRTDYGLYTYGSGILSLGSFWYPQLSVRQDGKWDDSIPEGPGDLNYSEMADFKVTVHTPADVIVAAPGDSEGAGSGPGGITFRADGVRDFAVLMSDDYVVKRKSFEVDGKPVIVSAYTIHAHADKADHAIDIAGHALQVYAKRFGSYAYNQFKVVEGPIRGGAGGMEFSGMTSIASAIYGDLQKQLGDLASGLGAGDLQKIMDELDGEDTAKPVPGAPNPTHPATGAQPTNAPIAPQTAEPALPDNAATDTLKSLLGQQGEIFASLFEVTISHEVAHQWWAIAVGNDSAGAPFVDESLANYSSMVYFEDRYGAAKAQQMIDLNLKAAYATGRMLGSPDAAANLPTSAYKNDLQYGAVVYGKGALYYDALRRLVGDPVFFQSLREYYRTYRGHLAGSRTLLGVVQSCCPARKAEIGSLYARWIEQTHGDEDITGGKVSTLDDLLGGLLGGLTGGLADTP